MKSQVFLLPKDYSFGVIIACQEINDNFVFDLYQTITLYTF
ncbi:hypothetical protein PT300_09380 [Enterobacteriaceae bacterium ESL0689]|nr:hypothetical protein [Enterobacteriaceae bacterium ESL0689]